MIRKRLSAIMLLLAVVFSASASAAACPAFSAVAAGKHIRVKMYDDAGRVIREVYGEADGWPEQESIFRYGYNGEILERIDKTNVR